MLHTAPDPTARLVRAALAAAARLDDPDLRAAAAEHRRVDAVLRTLLDDAGRCVVGPRGRAQVSAKEAAILRELVVAAPGGVSRADLAAVVWPECRAAVGRTVNTHICRLRAALAAAGARASVVTLPGPGWRVAL